MLKTTKEEENSIEIKIEMFNQHNYSGKVRVSSATIDKEAEINQKLTDKLKEYELGFKHESF